MDKLHIAQDENGFWSLSHEADDGTMSLLAHDFATPKHLIENAQELVDSGEVTATIVIGLARPDTAELQASAPDTDRESVPRKAAL